MIERITDSIDKNLFGVVFHSVQTIEDFQEKSGMEGPYEVEYQMHYINLVGRMEAEGQKLDIAIPMVGYSYYQEVSGAAIEFNLAEVGQANNEAMKIATQKFNEFETTDMYKSLLEYGITKWELHGMNSIHAHPSGINRFSGTDLRVDIKHPGICFPLSVGEDVPNFASIIQHKNDFAEIIHTEYRIFNGVENGERNYKKGRTLTIVKGVPEIPEPPQVTLVDGLIDKIFRTKRPQPPKPTAKKKRPSYVLRDGLTLKEGNAFVKEMMGLWEKCEFVSDTSMILKTNILRGRGRLQNTDSWGYSTHGKQKKNHLAEMNEGLFGNINVRDTELSDRPKILQFKDDDYGTPDKYIMIQFLVYKGYKREDIFKWTEAEIENEFWNERLEEMDEAVDENNYFINPSDIQKINALAEMNIMSLEKLNMLSPKDLDILYREILC